MEEIEKLKNILKKQNISLEKASREIGCSFKTILNWLNKENVPGEMSLIQIRKFIKKYENSKPLTD